MLGIVILALYGLIVQESVVGSEGSSWTRKNFKNAWNRLLAVGAFPIYIIVH